MVMKDSQQSHKKIYYTMGEVCDMFGVNASLIRFWEREMSVLRPKRNTKGNRLFTNKDIETLKLVYYLVKEKGMTLAGADKYMRQNREGVAREAEVMEHLLRVRAMLTELRTELGGEENVVAEFDDDPADEEFVEAMDVEPADEMAEDESAAAGKEGVDADMAEEDPFMVIESALGGEEVAEEIVETPMAEQSAEQQPVEEPAPVVLEAAEESAVDGKPQRRIVEQTLF